MRCCSKGGLFLYVAATLAAVSAPHCASGAALFWDGTNTSWNTNTAWSAVSNATTPDPLSPPGASDVANFNITTVNTAQTVNLNASQNAAGLIFSSTGTVLIQTGSGSNTLSLGSNGITVNSGAGADTISSIVKLGNSQVWTNNSTNTLTVSGIVTGSGDLTKSGTGTVVLSNSSNSYTGTTTVANGTLLAGAAGAIPVTLVNVNSPGIFNMGGFAQGIGSLTGSGTVTTTGATGSDTITIGNDNTTPIAFTGSINNAAGGRLVALAKVGTGTLTLGGSSNFSGGFTVNGGTLDLSQTTGVLTAAGNIFVATTPGQTATLTLDGKNSIMQTVSGALLSVGNSSTGAATLNIGTTASNAVLSTGTGTLSIFSTGTVNIGNPSFASTMNANGNVSIDAGVLARSNGSSFSLATGKTMTVQNGGRASFTGNYDTANATYNITGANSKLETLSTGNFRVLANGQVNVSSGASLASSGELDVFQGSLSVDGTGSAATGGDAEWGLDAPATINFSNAATGTVNALTIAQHITSTATVTANVLSGSSLSVAGPLSIDATGSMNGTLNVNGSGSLLSQSGANTITVGAATGTGAINIGTTNTGGTLTTGTGLITIAKTGNITIGSGANTGTLNVNGNVTVDGGALNLAAGSSFNLAAAKTMTIQNAGSASFSANNYIPSSNSIYNVTGTGSTWQFTGTNSLPIVSNSQVNVSSDGSLSTGGAINIASNGTAGTFTVDGSGSSAIASGVNSHWGQNGGAANVTFSNGANGQFPVGVSLSLGSTANSTATVSIQSGATWTNVANIEIGINPSTGSSATLTVTGVGSSVSQISTAPLTVGSAGPGVTNGTLTLTSGGAWNSNGTTAIQARGLVDILTPSSSFSANGNVLIDGGVLQVANGLSFTLSTGKTFTVQNGGRASFTGGYSTAANAIYNVIGTASKLENLASNSINIATGAQVNVTNGGLLTSLRNIDMANGGAGTLVVDGPGTSISAGLTSNWGFAGSTATATFSNNAAANFGTLNLVASSSAGAAANVAVQSGADLTAFALNLDSQGGSTSGTLTVTDAGSTVTLNNGTNSAFNIGASSGAATLNVNNNAAFTVVGNSSTTMGPSTVININAGSLALSTLTYNGGTVNLNSGSLSYGGNLTVGLGGMMGQNLTIDSTKSLSLTGTTTIDPFHTLTVSGGTFNTGNLVANGAFNFTSGTVGITGAGGLTVGSGGSLGSALTLNPGTTLNVTNATTINSGSSVTINGGSYSTGSLANSGNFVVNSGAAVITGALTNQSSGLVVIGQNAAAIANGVVTNNGELQLGGAAATLTGIFPLTNNGLIRGDGIITKPLNNVAGGEIRAEAGKRIKITGTLGTNNGKINLQGGTAEFQAFINGGGAQPGEIIGRGTLIVGGPGVTNNGNIALSGGISDVFGDLNNSTGLSNVGVSISGAGNITFWDDVTNAAGSLFKVSAGSVATFFGTYAGSGVTGAGQVNFESDVTPGFSPAAISFAGNVALSTTAKLKIEIGGTTAGTQFDRVQVANQLSLDGTLNVSLINGFKLAAGNSFDILDWSTLSGTFSTVQLPALAGGLDWTTSQLYTTGTLSVGGVLGDYNHNGTVDAADYVVWRKTVGQTGSGLAADGNGNNQIDPGDFDVWRTHFGQTAGSGSASSATGSASAAVPEPAATLLIAFLALCLAATGHDRRLTYGALHDNASLRLIT